MDLHWIYDLSNWLLGVLIVGIFTIVGLAGLYLTRPLVRRLHLIDRHAIYSCDNWLQRPDLPLRGFS